MVSKKFFFELILLFVIKNCYSQFLFGLKAGLSNNMIKTSITNRSYTILSSELGYVVGIKTSQKFSNNLSIESELDLIQKNYSLKRTEKYTGIYDKYKNTFLQFPLDLKYQIIKFRKLKTMFVTGCFISYWITSELSGFVPNVFNTTNTIKDNGEITQNFLIEHYSEKYHFNRKKDNRFEFGLNFGVSIGYDLNEKCMLLLDCYYFYSLTDLQKKYMINQVPKSNRTVLFGVGCLLKYPQKKK